MQLAAHHFHFSKTPFRGRWWAGARTGSSEPTTGKESRITETRPRKRDRQPPAASKAAAGNLILRSLPGEEYGLFAPHFEFVELAKGRTLQEPGSNMEHAYFLSRGLVSLVVELEEGKSLEVGMIGRECFLGAPSAMGIRDTHSRAIVQAPAEAFRIPCEQFAEILPAAPRLQLLLAHSVIRYNL